MKMPRNNRKESVKLNTTEARQARPAFTFRVLLIAMGLIVITFAIIYVIAETGDPEETAYERREKGDITNIQPSPEESPARSETSIQSDRP
ncbi:MAG: hypothetical protein P1V21_09190 [Rhizobiaceae bacterium]|nr:hypothetical protein [Rhizobiaceae bacterium]